MVVDVGGVRVGGERPIVVQSMTNTDTADVAGTVAQVRALHAAGSELVRVTVNNDAAARAVPEIVRQVEVPIIGDFHYNGHVLLIKYPDCAKALAKYRINPGNVGGKHHDDNFRAIVQVAIDNDKPVRIGVNWGSLDQNLLTEMMDANAKSREPLDARDVTMNAIVESAIQSAELAEQTGLPHDRIILSAKVSGVQELRQVKTLIREIRLELDAEGIAYNRELLIGIMIEVPSAAVIADMLATEADFFAIGTNDLIQYSLAIDRGNENVSYLYEPLHPAILRVIMMVRRAAARQGIPVSLCGEMASDPALLALLVGLGLREFSMTPGALGVAKQVLSEVRTDDLRALARRILRLPTVEEMEQELVEVFGKKERLGARE